MSEAARSQMTPPSEGLPALEGRLALRPAELARALGVSERTIRKLASRLPHLRIGGVLLFPTDDVRVWLRDEARRQRRATTELAAEIEREMRRGGE